MTISSWPCATLAVTHVYASLLALGCSSDLSEKYECLSLATTKTAGIALRAERAAGD
jgi:hypothetical protein